MVASPAEIARLFAELASGIEQLKDVGGSGDLRGGLGEAESAAISSLSASLTSDDIPRVRVLDAALSLMCFRASEVHKTWVECLIETMVSMLNSSISCKALRNPDGGARDVLMVGNSFSSRDCVGLVRACADVLRSLKDHCAGDSHALLYAVIKAVISSCTFHNIPPPSSSSSGKENIDCAMKIELSKLVYILSEETSCRGHECPLRLLFWYLDPMILKHDISEILQELIQRPLLYLKKELHDQITWRNIVVCLATSPTIFVETRAMLHGWFLVTGLTSVLDLKIGIVSAVLDILSRPMWWQLPIEVGLQLPRSCAYFSARHHELLCILSGPLSCKNLLHLVHYMKAEVASMSSSPKDIACIIDCNSSWTLLIDFPAWFYFAIALIFYRNSSEDHFSKALSSRLRTEAVDVVGLHEAAIYYISWILFPVDEARNQVTATIDELSKSLIMDHKRKSTYDEKSDSNIQLNVPTHGKKLKIPKVSNSEKLQMTAQYFSVLDIGIWLNKFNAVYVRLCNKKTNNSYVLAAPTSENDCSMKPNLLFARVPIGLLFVLPNYLDEMGCEMLLHYAATGQMMQIKERCKSSKDIYEYSGAVFESYCSKWSFDGACLVFNLTDIIDDISIMLFDSEDNRIDFVSQMKHKTSRYLIRCLRMLLNLQKNQSGVVSRDTILDLHRRMLTWKQQGQEMFEGHKEFDDFVEQFSERFKFSD